MGGADVDEFLLSFDCMLMFVVGPTAGILWPVIFSLEKTTLGDREERFSFRAIEHGRKIRSKKIRIDKS